MDKLDKEQLKSMEAVEEELEELEKQEPSKGKVKIYVGKIGGDVAAIEVDEGTTFGTVKKSHNMTNNTVRLNQNDAADATILNNGDIVLAVPAHVTGGKR